MSEGASAEIRFVYLDCRGRGEIDRLVLLAAGQDFQDVRLPYPAGWNDEAKKATPYGQLPYMEYRGKKYGQSVAIANFFAREFGLYGKTNVDALRIDEVVLLAEDIKYRDVTDWWHAPNAEVKAQVVEKMKTKTFPKYLTIFEQLLSENSSPGLFVGNSVSYADLVMYDLLDIVLGLHREAIADYPLLRQLRINVEAIPAVKRYLDARPVTME